MPNSKILKKIKKSKSKSGSKKLGRVRRRKSNPCSLRNKPQCGGDPNCHFVKRRGCVRRSGVLSGKKVYQGPVMPLGNLDVLSPFRVSDSPFEIRKSSPYSVSTHFNPSDFLDKMVLRREIILGRKMTLMELQEFYNKVIFRMRRKAEETSDPKKKRKYKAIEDEAFERYKLSGVAGEKSVNLPLVSVAPKVISSMSVMPDSSIVPYGSSSGSSIVPYGSSSGSSIVPYGSSSGSSIVPYGSSSDSAIVPYGSSSDSAIVPYGSSSGSSIVPYGSSSGSSIVPYGQAFNFAFNSRLISSPTKKKKKSASPKKKKSASPKKKKSASPKKKKSASPKKKKSASPKKKKSASHKKKKSASHKKK